MKLQIASDLHLEFLHQRFQRFETPPLPFSPDANALLLTGDIHKARRVLKAFSGWPVPIIYVAGNHEFYGGHLHQDLTKLKDAAKGSNIHVLERDELILDGVRFLGTTMWTDFALFGEDHVDKAMAHADEWMNDYRKIRTHYRRLRARDTRAIHVASRKWLEEKLAEPFSGTTVVLTHHAPSKKSIPAKYENDLLSAAFASDLEDLMGVPALWVHGHVHETKDYEIGATRVIANPRGYPENSARELADIAWGNKDFSPTLTLRI